MRPIAAALILAGVLSAQNKEVTRAETRSVLVDVLVTDKKGNYIRDLKEKDFQVYEDGKEQTVDGLFVEGLTTGAPAQSVILLFDTATMTAAEQSKAKQVAAQLVDQFAAAAMPNTAVVSFGGALRVTQTFSTDATRVKQALAKVSVGALSGLDPNATTGPNSQSYIALDLMRSLEGLAKNLQASTGRKTLVFFTAGYSVDADFDRAMAKVVGAANQANVSFYPVQMRTVTTSLGAQLGDASDPAPVTGGRGTRGVSTIGGRGAAPATTATVSSSTLAAPLDKLADATGGFLVRQPDDTPALSRITQEQGQFYILSYSPPDSAEGSCHKLRVKVKRDNTNLRAREGYCKHAPGDVLSGNPVERELEQRAAAQAAGNIPATMQATYFPKAPNVARAMVAMDIVSTNVAFKRDKSKFLGQIDILGVATQADGGIGARFSDSVKLEFSTQAEVDKFKSKPYRYENQFDIAPGEYKLAIALSSGTGNFGRAEIPLTVEARKPDELGLSAIALSREFHPVNSAASSALDEFLIDDHKKLIGDGMEITLASSSKLKSTGPAGMFVEIYTPQAGPLVVQLRILDRATGAMKMDSGPLRLESNFPPGSNVIPLALSLPLQGLTPGAYTMEFDVQNTAGKSAKRTAAFEIE